MVTNPSGPIILAMSNIPIIQISSGNMASTDGLLNTLTGVLPYVPINVVRVVVAASAGLAASVIFATFSSTTACQLWTNLAGTIKPVTTVGPYTADITERVMTVIAVPANSMGPNGLLRLTCSWGYTNSANTKVIRHRWGVAPVGGGGLTMGSGTATTTVSVQTQTLISNINNLAQQKTGQALFLLSYTASTTPPNIATANTAVACEVNCTCTMAAAAEFCSLESFLVELIPAPAS